MGNSPWTAIAKIQMVNNNIALNSGSATRRQNIVLAMSIRRRDVLMRQMQVFMIDTINN